MSLIIYCTKVEVLPKSRYMSYRILSKETEIRVYYYTTYLRKKTL